MHFRCGNFLLQKTRASLGLKLFLFSVAFLNDRIQEIAIENYEIISFYIVTFSTTAPHLYLLHAAED